MTDIVERLRSFGPEWTKGYNDGKAAIPYQVCAEAADEIERLRRVLGECQAGWATGERAIKENERLRSEGCAFNAPCSKYRGLLADIDELQREIERLRAVLRMADAALKIDEQQAAEP